jgi:hypothetical protein
MVNLTTWLPPAVVPAAKQVEFLATPSAVLIVAKAADPLIPAAKQVQAACFPVAPAHRPPCAILRDYRGFASPLALTLWLGTMRLSASAEPGDLGRVIDPPQPAPDAHS